MDNFSFTEGSGKTGAADEIGGVLYPRVKIAQGADGSATDVSSAAPLQVTLANTGANATAVKTDGSAVTQPVSAASLPLPTGASTSAKQDTIIGHVDGIETLLTTIDADTGNVSTKIDTVAGAVSGTEMQVDIVAPLPAGTNGIGKLTANSGVTIGAVEIASAQTLATVTTLTGGGVAHDGADSGNPVKVGAKASGTLSDDTMVANGDRTDATSDLDGALLVRPQFPLGDLLSERVSNTDGNSTAFTNFGATASTRSYITAYSIFRTDAGTTPIYVDFRDGTAGSILYSVVIPPNGGANLASAHPLFRTSANTALAYDVSGATTTVYISVTGFKSKV